MECEATVLVFYLKSAEPDLAGFVGLGTRLIIAGRKSRYKQEEDRVDKCRSSILLEEMITRELRKCT